MNYRGKSGEAVVKGENAVSRRVIDVLCAFEKRVELRCSREL